MLRLAATRDLRSIIQVAYLTPDSAPTVIDSELGQAPVDARVLDHFRNIHRISELCAPAGPRIHVFDLPFSARGRQDYACAVIAQIRALVPRPAAVFLDPDTGLAEKPASAKHVTSDEVAAIWSVLEPADWLVLYQHAAREKDWLNSRRASFAGACGGARVVTFRATSVPRDVAFFAARRGTTA